MGNEGSSPINPSPPPPQTLHDRTLASLAHYIHSPHCTKIVTLVGAGISTSAGIPDFRSPTTGLYANLARLDLPYPEAVFDLAYFRQRPEAFYTLARELYPGQFRPTITHSFLKLLQDKGLLWRHFTQNIDCLERVAGVEGERIVEAHGSFGAQACVECGGDFDGGEMRRCVERGVVPRCAGCGGLVKPGIVFFGDALPEGFFESRGVVREADLVVVMGTSLMVQPFAGLAEWVREGVPRVLINRERVGGLGARGDDVLVLGECDEGVREVARACGWLGELEGVWAATAGVGEGVGKGRDEVLSEEIERLTREVDETLDLARWHQERPAKVLEGEARPSHDGMDRVVDQLLCRSSMCHIP
ncbi:NAD-dependent deacetylase sirtuin-2 [Teratosphaeria nubilosa]|uniref:NAD-dependent protein deacetylase n=1 Tax=Teratosphaeria nubilosa TaxID=161662 RepID=A0A6G1LCQ7_9PEZI|nr:NAD-dependent deacetylase sirtuin-2 [Teratosphaeria nubilosa]